MLDIFLKDESATNDLGKSIAKLILESSLESIEIHLNGDLGTGKTFLTKSILKNSFKENSFFLIIYFFVL